jgi:hypothetical protein
MTVATAVPATRPFPTIDSRLIVTILLAGALAVAVWEVWARQVTPLIIGGPLEPAALVQTVFGLNRQSIFGEYSRTVAEAIHLVVGVVFYPIGYLFIARPLQRTVLPGLPLVLTGIGFGVGLWVFALYVMAHLFGGLPAFLNFGKLAWVSLIGHVLFGVVVAYVVRYREARA